jgi:hypothetical protein
VPPVLREQDVADALGRRRLVGGESRIAGEERIDQYRLALEVEAKGGMSVPGDLHDKVPLAASFAEDGARIAAT